jgi:hypothetical protein
MSTVSELHDSDDRRFAAAVADAREAARRGEVVPYERVRTWLHALAKGRREPPPLP